MIVEVHLKETSQTVFYKNVENTYTKGPLYCIMLDNNLVHKFPLSEIFKIIEED